MNIVSKVVGIIDMVRDAQPGQPIAKLLLSEDMARQIGEVAMKVGLHHKKGWGVYREGEIQKIHEIAGIDAVVDENLPAFTIQVCLEYTMIDYKKNLK